MRKEGKTIITTIAMVKASFEIEHGPNAAEVTNMHEVGTRKVEMCSEER